MRLSILILFLGLYAFSSSAQLFSPPRKFTAADTLRGSDGPFRKGWDVLHYDLAFTPDLKNRSLSGRVAITFLPLQDFQPVMQIDLQKPLTLDSALWNGNRLTFTRVEQAFLVYLPQGAKPSGEQLLTLYYSGVPRVAPEPPWDGGLVWATDSKGNPWVAVACQGLGASVWWPCKDYGADEPDRGVRISGTVSRELLFIANGKLAEITETAGSPVQTMTWEVKAPINSYNVTFYIGAYNRHQEVFQGKSGPLLVTYWFLNQDLERAKEHLVPQTAQMLAIFENWFGPYPFYEDGYQLVHAPYLGMEHQSAVAYGNNFLNGYLGTDLSYSGWGLMWDYILIHETGHEWFGNNISVKDVADLWVHEGFTTYSEVLYVESRFGRRAADEYAQGLRLNIQNDAPVIGIYGVNHEGSGDMYYKGVQIIHTYRAILNDDAKFQDLLHEMNRRFGRKTVTSHEVEMLMQEYAGINLTGFFNTYLRTVKMPQLNYSVRKQRGELQLRLWFTGVEKDFAVPLNLTVDGKAHRIMVSDKPSDPAVIPIKSPKFSLEVDPNYYIRY
jgi:aminopeptidase N